MVMLGNEDSRETKTNLVRLKTDMISYVYRKDFMGECDKKTTFEILDFFYENGGNFIDT